GRRSCGHSSIRSESIVKDGCTRRIWGRGHADHVRIAARASSVVSTQSVEVSRARTQSAHIPTQRIPHVKVLISAYKTTERIAERYVQTIPIRSTAAAPVRREAATGNVRSGIRDR